MGLIMAIVIEIFTIHGTDDMINCCGSGGLHSQLMFDHIHKWCRRELNDNFDIERYPLSTKWKFFNYEDAKLFTDEWSEFVFEND